MKYSKEERLDIGAKIYHNEITKYEAAERYGISVYSAREYMRMYRDAHGLTEKNELKSFNKQGWQLILHSDQGSVCASKSFNESESGEQKCSPLFCTIGNCTNRPCRFALFGNKQNLDRQATSGGCYPLFCFIKLVRTFSFYRQSRIPREYCIHRMLRRKWRIQ